MSVLEQKIRTNLYTVEAGDTVQKIAETHNISLAKLLTLNRNRLKDPNVLKIGQTLRIK